MSYRQSFRCHVNRGSDCCPAAIIFGICIFIQHSGNSKICDFAYFQSIVWVCLDKNVVWLEVSVFVFVFALLTCSRQQAFSVLAKPPHATNHGPHQPLGRLMPKTNVVKSYSGSSLSVNTRRQENHVSFYKGGPLLTLNQNINMFQFKLTPELLRGWDT